MKSGNSKLPTRIHSNKYSFNKKMSFYYLSGHVPQNDWHTVLALFCITTAYQTQLVHGSHRSAYDPEKFSKAWEIAESLFGKKKSEILEKIQRIWMTLKWTEAIFTYDL